MKPLAAVAMFLVSTEPACAPRWFHEEHVEDVAMQMAADACDHPDDVSRRWLTYDETMAMTRLRPSREAHAHDIAVFIMGLCGDAQRSALGRREVVGAVSAPADGDPRLAPGVTGAIVRYVVKDRIDGTRSTPGHAFPFVRTGRGWRLASDGDISDRVYLGLPDGSGSCTASGGACTLLTACCAGNCGALPSNPFSSSLAGGTATCP
jgi:hypothetical protein